MVYQAINHRNLWPSQNTEKVIEKIVALLRVRKLTLAPTDLVTVMIAVFSFLSALPIQSPAYLGACSFIPRK